MAKELPYFRFYPSEWLEGDITLENEKTQGFFTLLCAWYWKKDCDVDLKFINKRLIKGKATLKQCLETLIDSEIVKISNGEEITIKFLDEQFYLLGQNRDKRVEAGRKGGKALLKHNPSYKDKDNNKDKKYDENIHSLYADIVIYFDEDLRPKDEKSKDLWLDCLDKLVRIDKKTPEQIRNITKRTRMDDFWRTNFLSVLKLRKKNGDQIPYFTVFEKKIRPNTKGSKYKNPEDEVMTDKI